MTSDDLKRKCLDGGRLSTDEALSLFETLPLCEMGWLADQRRRQIKGSAYGGQGASIVTYLVDRNINYSNVCTTGCRFCAFYRAADAPDAYVLSHSEIERKIVALEAIGGTQILLQGGHHPSLKLQDYLSLISFIKQRFPRINIHGFSAPEFHHFSEIFKETVESLLRRFKDAGLGSIPGAGAEILSDRVRRQVAPRKCTAERWIEIMRAAHEASFRTTATMMFGHIETHAERVEHLQRLRALQDDTGGFTAFICWTFQPENTLLPIQSKSGAHDYLKTLALSRLFLDNFENLQASWVTQGLRIGQLSLEFGANDFGSTMMEENVVSSAGTAFSTTVEEIESLIRQTKREPRQRDNFYNLFQ